MTTTSTDGQKTLRHSDYWVNKVFGERLHSLIEDGYIVRVKYDKNDLLFARLVHRTNGNQVKLYGYKQLGTVKQYTNDYIKFIGVYGHYK